MLQFMDAHQDRLRVVFGHLVMAMKCVCWRRRDIETAIRIITPARGPFGYRYLVCRLTRSPVVLKVTPGNAWHGPARCFSSRALMDD